MSDSQPAPYSGNDPSAWPAVCSSDKIVDVIDVMHILIVWGREDKAIPLRCGEEMHRILKGSRLEIIDHAGHVPNFERAKVFNKLASDFLIG